MKVFAIVVTYNGLKWYDRCLNSLTQSTQAIQIIVVDNASSDGSANYIKQRFPDIHLIENRENFGFAKANNLGIRYAIDHEADFIFLLNQDAWIEPDSLTKLLQTFEDNKNTGIASPIHLNGTCTGLDRRFCKYLPSDFISDLYCNQLQKYYLVPYVNAAAWLISKECIKKIGGFDTSIFQHCGEDDNYCQRLSYHHLSLVINTTTTICHDRQDRKDDNSTDTNREQWADIIRKEEIAEKWSNINNDYPMRKIQQRFHRKYILSCILLQHACRKKYKELAEICHKTFLSREINKKEGLSWL